jgi:hypothetical protein
MIYIDAVSRFSFAAMILVLNPSSAWKPSESIEQVSRLRTARAAHTATALRSGEVLVVAGMTSNGGSLAEVELFDPAHNSVHQLDPLAEARVSHTATLLNDGRVLIAGGYNGEYLASVEVFDPSARRFRSAGSLLEGRSGHTATLLPDGRVLFIGGVGRGWTFLQSAEVYDPRTGQSEQVGSMSMPRESHTATLLDDGHVLVIGGHTGRRPNMEVHSSAEIFSVADRRFTSGGTLGTPRHKHDAHRLADGRVVVIGGADRTDRVHFATTEVYDPGTNRFERGPSMANQRYKIAGTSIRLPNGDLLVTSGARTAELLDLRRWRFRAVSGALPAAYHFATATQLAGGDVIIAGGYDERNQNTAGIWRFRRAP